MEKLGQLHRSGAWDLIVVDTPPSRSALDFLDAPERMGRFLDGRLIKVLMAPAKAGGRFGMKVVTAGFGMFTSVITKVLGGQLLRDMQTFVLAFDTMFGGFRERADQTYKLLQAPGTAFLVVAAPERDALREASYFVERLAEERMPLAGLVVNRVHRSDASTPVGRTQPGGGRDARVARRPRADRRAAAAARRAHAGRRPRDAAARELHLVPPDRAGGDGRRDGRGRARPGGSAEHRRRPRGRGHEPRPDRPSRRGGQAERAISSRRALLLGLGPLVLLLGGLQQLTPRRDVGPPAQQRATLALGHAAPDTELDPVVEGVREALGAHRAATADQLRPVLRGALHEQRVGIRVTAGGAGGPIRDPHLGPTPLGRLSLRAPAGRARTSGRHTKAVGKNLRNDGAIQQPPMGPFSK